MPFHQDAAGAIWCDQDDTGVKRSERWRRRARAQSLSARVIASNEAHPLKRLLICGASGNNDVGVKYHEHRCFYSGVISCGSIWTCATCSARIRVRREAELEKAAIEHCKRGGQLAMLTLTARHKRRNSLTETLDALLGAWRQFQCLSAWKRGGTTGVMDLATGYVRALEVTYGENGWHPHLHTLLFIEPGCTELDALQMVERAKSTWATLVRRKLGLAPSQKHGLHLLWFGADSQTAAHYIAKVAKEMTFAESKSGRDPMTLLDDTEPQSVAMFIEYAEAMHKKRALTWSRGLRQQLGLLDAEPTDDELADANNDVGTEVAVLSGDHYRSLSWKDRLSWLEFFEHQQLLEENWRKAAPTTYITRYFPSHSLRSFNSGPAEPSLCSVVLGRGP